MPGYSDEIVHVYYAEVEKIKLKSLYNKNENEEIKIFKLTLNQLKKINQSKSHNFVFYVRRLSWI